MTFNLDGTRNRKLNTPCKHCGALSECDDCWEHTRDWSPFGVWLCLVCAMPQAYFDGGVMPMTCQFCGWDEAESTTTIDHA